jgi:UDP-N-acetylglucosamine 2-epimerase (non-hydrolysing)
MKVMTVVGTRPEVIRLSRVIEKLDGVSKHCLVHTGQNYDPRLSDIFFEQLGVRRPDYCLAVQGKTFGDQVAGIIRAGEQAMLDERPDRVLILGDTNSSLVAIVAKRLGIPVYHMEAGNRCYDDRVPEEVNRRIIDHTSDVLMPYTERSRANLLREGIPGDRVFVVGNPIFEVIRHYEPQISQSDVLATLGLEAGRYFLVTMHRAENVDIASRLTSLIEALNHLQRVYDLPVVVSTHPHTRKRMEAGGLGDSSGQVKFMPPFGFFDFIALERNALCVLSDSGTVQEECCIFKVANVTIRDVTERPETIECGSNILAGSSPDTILQCVKVVLSMKHAWTVPREYLFEDVSDTVVGILMGFKR